MPRSIVIALAAALLLAAAPVASAAPPRTSKVRCTGDPAAVNRLDVAVAGEQAWGLYALPAGEPKGLVAFFHGYTHTAHSWAEHIRRTAAQDGVIALAMNYRGQIDGPPYPGTTLPRSRGWQVSEGAADSIAAAQLFDRSCPGLPSIVAYGVSMGGNASGLAVASRATRTSGAPLFDQWFDIEGAVNVIEIYTAARVLAATGNTMAAHATEDIEREMGGPIESRPEAYTTRTVVRRAEDIKASGVRGVTLVHGADDGLVPYSQSREMQARLLGLGHRDRHGHGRHARGGVGAGYDVDRQPGRAWLHLSLRRPRRRGEHHTHRRQQRLRAPVGLLREGRDSPLPRLRGRRDHADDDAGRPRRLLRLPEAPAIA